MVARIKAILRRSTASLTPQPITQPIKANNSPEEHKGKPLSFNGIELHSGRQQAIYNGQDLEHAWNRLDDGSYLDIDPNLGMNRGDHFVRYELSKEHFIELLRRKYPNDFSEIFNGNKPFRDINIKDVEKYLPEIKEVF